MMRRIFVLVISLLILGYFGQEVNMQQKSTQHTAARQKLADKAMSFEGTVVLLGIEGGFLGVLTNDGQKLDGGLPIALRKEGLVIKGRYRVVEGVGSTRMWGKQVEFSHLELITDKGRSNQF